MKKKISQEELNEMVMGNLGLVPATFNRFKQTPFIKKLEEDLMQEGYIGLIKAVLTFKKSKGTFSTYATVCIRNAMVSYIRREKRSEISYCDVDSFVEVSDPCDYIN